MKRLLTSSLFLIVFAFSFAQNSSIDFEIKNLGITVDGFFKNFTVITKFDDSDNLIDFSSEIKAKSIETGIDSRDEHLLEEDYFHTYCGTLYHSFIRMGTYGTPNRWAHRDGSFG